MSRWCDGWVLILVVIAAVAMLAGCGRDDLGALLVRWPF